ncbi:Lrp/AsnC family transcriptional regulator [Thermoplasma sp.]|uniref:Lrp/AsnC family transcriptional regulator n=1 Tax=Thermoplasma sp. TaxID=1973142 RepID=UPI0012713F43|nr:Lrp/AsnC family transcriptional regulator [Thermoplasma sp.]KAA8921961.1 MAG: Lrp/AsnC family transcriptional regulator [Thermoplasma sp.]
MMKSIKGVKNTRNTLHREHSSDEYSGQRTTPINAKDEVNIDDLPLPKTEKKSRRKVPSDGTYKEANGISMEPAAGGADVGRKKRRSRRSGYHIKRFAFLGNQSRISPLDNKILEILRNDCRIEIGKLSIMLGVTPSTIKRHIDWLRSKKLIIGFTTLLNPNLFHSAIRCFIVIRFRNKVSESTIKRIDSLNYAGSFYRLCESNALLIDTVSQNLEDLEYLEDKISRMKDVVKVESILTSKSYKKNPWYCA